MPRQIKDLKELLAICGRKDCRHVKIKKNKDATKFKVRCSKYLYTYVENQNARAEKITKSIHKSVNKIIVTARSHSSKKKQ